MTTAYLAPSSPTDLAVQVNRQTRIKPRIVDQLNDWQYLERSIHRLLCGWGRHFCEWDGKSACHRHVWEQAALVTRLRERIEEFPGGKPNAPVSKRLEELANAVLLAPSFEDALDGIYLLLAKALASSYSTYVRKSHPVHDAPTVRLLHDITGAKEQEWLWYREWRRNHPHLTDLAYRGRVEQALAACGHLQEPLSVEEAARPCGVRVEFRLPLYSGRPNPWKPKFDFMPYVYDEFATNIDARRLFWAWGYMMEKNIPDDQLKWLWYGHDMPWEFQHDISRHLWDESRHGDSGLSRLMDFGIPLDAIGFPYQGQQTEDLSVPAEPMGPKKLYDEIFWIGMIAETGYFEVKNEAFSDFRDGNDMVSAEMMLFDIIDETAHVQYAHKWLPLLAEKAGIDNSDYRERAVRMRKQQQQEAINRIAQRKGQLERTPSCPDYVFYQDCLRRIRACAPLSQAPNAARSPVPM